MGIEFNDYECGGKYFKTVGLSVEIKNDGHIVSIEGAVFIDELEQILAKMKELQSPNKDIEFLQADISELEMLLESATARDDHVNEIQLSNRIAQRKRELEELQSEAKS